MMEQLHHGVTDAVARCHDGPSCVLSTTAMYLGVIAAG